VVRLRQSFGRARVGLLDSLKGGERVAVLDWAYGARFRRHRRAPSAAVRLGRR
jgi:hypothetical protein